MLIKALSANRTTEVRLTAIAYLNNKVFFVALVFLMEIKHLIRLRHFNHPRVKLMKIMSDDENYVALTRDTYLTSHLGRAPDQFSLSNGLLAL